MQTLEPILHDHPFFQGLEPDAIRLLAGCASNVRFHAGDYLFREGQPADAFFLVRQGRVALEIASPSHSPIVIQTVDEGDVAGFSWLFPPHRWQFDGRAMELTRVVQLDGACLRGKAEQDPRLGYDLMKRFSQVMLRRLQAARLQLMDVYGHAGAR
jgi:CRP/FNR family cyclic AMP-dependent transcriptional regulator